MTDVESRLARLEERMSALREELGELQQALGDLTRPGSIRARLHELENDRTSVRAAEQATRNAREAVASSQRERWSRKELIFAGIVALSALAAPLVTVLVAVFVR